MKINHAKKIITLDGTELATAIDSYLVAHGVTVTGPRRVHITGEDDDGMVYLVQHTTVDIEVHPTGKIEDKR